MAAKKTQSKKSSRSRRRALDTTSSTDDQPRLLGKVAVVTGASRGIGYATARLLALQGANVVMAARDRKRLLSSARTVETSISKTALSGRKRQARVVAQVCDVGDPDSVAALFGVVRREFGAVDILINNAGVIQPTLTVEEISVELWREVVDTDLTGPFLCTRAALPLMRRGGTIVNNISAAAKQVFPKLAAYTAAKHGLLGFTLSLREELIPRGIRVVAFMAGATDTELWDRLWPEAPRERMIPASTVADAILFTVLLPSRANLSEFLLTPITGAL